MVEAAKNALTLWAGQLVPSLFPFMILSGLFLKLSYRYLNIKSKRLERLRRHVFGLSVHGCYIFILGHICGYPLGGKMTANAYKDQKITRGEADYLMTICNQSSPAFLEFYVCAYALNNIISGYSLLFLFLSGTMITSFITRKIYPMTPTQDNSLQSIHSVEPSDDRNDFWSNLDACISESCLTILRVGGYVILFSILSDFLLSLEIFPYRITCLFVSTLEITNGLFILKNTFASEFYYPFLILALSAFGGFCSMAQIKGMLIGTSLSIKPYIIGKIIYTLIIFLLTILLFQIKILKI